MVFTNVPRRPARRPASRRRGKDPDSRAGLDPAGPAVVVADDTDPHPGLVQAAQILAELQELRWFPSASLRTARYAPIVAAAERCPG